MLKHTETVLVVEKEDVRIQKFLDITTPSVVRFETDYFICGSTYRCVWALRECLTSIEKQAISKRPGEKDEATLKIYTRHVSAAEERKIISNAASKNRLSQSNTSDLQQTVQAGSNLQDVAMIVARIHRNQEPLLHTTVYMELTADEYDRLRSSQTEALTELVRSKLNMDRLPLRQKQGFQYVMPSGRNVLRDQFERVLPTGSVMNLYPFNYSGKTDPHGSYVGRDKFGSNILVDFNQRVDDKINSSIPILGSSGQGKSYLLKPILYDLREAGLNVICLDPEMEYEDLTNNPGGCSIDPMGGRFLINPLEPGVWNEGEGPEDPGVPKTFRIRSQVNQHISFLKDFSRSHKDFMDREISMIGIMVQRLYTKCGLTDEADFRRLGSRDYPTLSELYEFIEAKYRGFDIGERQLYTVELLQNILLRLHSMRRRPEVKFLNGRTNITDSSFVAFGVKGVLQAGRNFRDALLSNTLSFASNRLLMVGDTAAELDEFYLFLPNLTAVEYVRNSTKHVRKKSPPATLVSQNLEDFNIEGVREYTKPLLSIPTRQFLPNAGAVDEKFYMDALQLEASESSLIRYPQRGVCLYRYGDECYNLVVMAPDYRTELSREVDKR